MHTFLHGRVISILHFGYLLQLSKCPTLLPPNWQKHRGSAAGLQLTTLLLWEWWKRKSRVHSAQIGAECSVNSILICHCWFKRSEWPKRAPPPVQVDWEPRLLWLVRVPGSARKASKHCEAHAENKIRLKLRSKKISVSASFRKFQFWCQNV